MAQKKGAGSHGSSQGNGSAHAPSNSSLIISRNKHWRYISAFHGPWLQLPSEVLQSLAHQNYYMPQPRLVDPAVFFDVVKIRRAVDDATEEAVRASTGVSSSQSNNSSLWPDQYGGSAPAPKMSRERVHKIRQKSVKLLAKAYTLDEVAASVATMQSTSSLEDVAEHVLRKDKNDLDAKYVHFYHEKIPSRMMEDHTPLEPLTEIIQNLPFESQAAPLRTRGLVKIFKQEFEGAVADFTMSLRIVQELNARHRPGADQLVLASQFAEERKNWNVSGRDWRSVPQVKDDEQPTGLEQQLLFNRAGVYITLAAQTVASALHGLKEHQAKMQTSNGDDHPSLTAADKHVQNMRLEARKRVKTYAKRALRDYMAFLSFLEYSPGLSMEVTNEVRRRVNDLAAGGRPGQRALKDRQNNIESPSTLAESDSNALIKRKTTDRPNGSRVNGDSYEWPTFSAPKIHPVSALFAEKPPSGLPSFPISDSGTSNGSGDAMSFGSREAVTYHPLLSDVLHSVLLCHALLQTSTTELLRHAHNAARLLRIADGYPIFQSARSPSRADFIEILRRTKNWIGLSQSWPDLCRPAPFETDSYEYTANDRSNPSTNSHSVVQKNHKPKEAVETEDEKRERINRQAVMDSLSDERVVDDATFERAVKARTARALADERETDVKRSSAAKSPSPEQRSTTTKKSSREEEEDLFDYPFSSERADAISRWILEAPTSMGGGTGKKKRPARKKKAPSNGVDDAVDKLDKMGLDQARDGAQDDEEVD